MKNDFEMYQSVLSRRDEHRRKKESRKLVIKRTVPVLACFCFCAVLGLGYWNHAERLHDIPTVTETVTTAVNSSAVTETTSTQTTQNMAVSSESTSPKTTTGITVTDTTKTTVTTTQQASVNTNKNENTSVRNTEQTTVRTTQTPAATSADASHTTTTLSGNNFSELNSSTQDDNDMSFTGTLENQKPDVRTTTAENQGPSMKPSDETEPFAKPSSDEDIISFSYQGFNYYLHYNIVDRSELTEISSAEPAVIYDHIEGKEKTSTLNYLKHVIFTRLFNIKILLLF